MGDDQHTATVGTQETFEPLNHPDVEMVGRLVQKEEVWLAKQSLGQTDTRLLTAGEMLDILLEVIIRKAQTIGDLFDAAVKLITV